MQIFPKFYLYMGIYEGGNVGTGYAVARNRQSFLASIHRYYEKHPEEIKPVRVAYLEQSWLLNIRSMILPWIVVKKDHRGKWRTKKL